MNTTTATLRKYFHISPRTRRFRGNDDLFARMLESVELAATQPGYFNETTEQALHPAFGAVLAYRKHVDGYRIDGMTISRIKSLSPWQFAALIGQMVDAGVTNTGEGERFFRAMA
jgi:hypothetical protein